MKQLETTALKALPANCDINVCMEVLEKFGEGEWFVPNNRGSNDYAVCDTLAYYNLIESKRTPLFKDGQPCGVKVSFLYKHDLNY